jgi:hypothetical protein
VRLRRLVSDVPSLWDAPDTSMDERKRLLRCLIHEVVVTRDMVAKGAYGTTTSIPLPEDLLASERASVWWSTAAG